MGKNIDTNTLTFAKQKSNGIKVDSDAPDFPYHDIIGYVQTDGANPATAPQKAVFTAGGNVRGYVLDTNDLVDITFHIPHDYAPGSDVFLHVHYGHNGTAVDATTFDLSAYVAYASRDTGVFTEVTTAGFSIDMDTHVQYQHYVEEIQISATSPAANQIDSDDIEVDGLIIVTLKATQIPTITGGSGKPFFFTCDLHYQSTNIGTKNKDPDFYT